MPAPFPLIPLTRPQAHVLQMLAGSGRSFSTSFEGEPWTIRFLPSFEGAPPEFAVPMLLAGRPALLTVFLSPGGNWHRRFESAPPLDTVPEPFRSALRAALCEEILDRFETVTGLTATLSARPVEPSSEDVLVHWEALNERGDREAAGCLSLDKESAETFLRNLPPAPRAAAGGWTGGLPVGIPVALETFTVATKDFFSSRPGDVWLLEAKAGEAIATGVALLPGGLRRPCRISGLDAGAISSEPAADRPCRTESMETPAPNHWTDTVEVELTFQVGKLTLTMDQLRALDEGYVFELTTAADEPVSILVNGHPAGRGQLVRIGDRLGVQLTSTSVPA